MYVGIAILLDERTGEISKRLTYELDREFGTGLDFAYLLQHVSLKQSFPYDGALGELEDYFHAFFTGIEPFLVCIDGMESKDIDGKALVWLKVRESKELQALHEKLCAGLYGRFGIEPLGFDGAAWRFHSTLAYSEVPNDAMRRILLEYNSRELQMEFTARRAVMFCSQNMNPASFLCFEPKQFKLGRQ